MNSKRKRIGVYLAVFCLLSLALSPACAATAPLAEPLTQLYLSGQRLLMEEIEFTAVGQADFYLDQALFKHAEGVYAQENTKAYQQIDLTAPREDGSTRKNGYAVLDSEGEVYCIERYAGKTIANYSTNPENDHMLRGTVATRMLLRTGASMARVLDAQMAEWVAVSPWQDGCRIEIICGEDQIPALAGNALSLFWKEAAERFFSVQYQTMPLEGYAEISDYPTVTQGILYCVRDLKLQAVEMTALLDSEWRIVSLKGDASVELTLRNEGQHFLDVSFSLDVKDYENTDLENVIPTENKPGNAPMNSMNAAETAWYFNLMSASDLTWEELGYPNIPLPESRITPREIASAADAKKYAAEIASMDALALPDAEKLAWTVTDTEQGYLAAAADPRQPEEPVVSMVLSPEGKVIRYENLQTGFEQADASSEEELDSDLTVRWREEIGVMLWMFEENINPGATMLSAAQLLQGMSYGHGYTQYQETLKTNGESFLVMYGTLYQDPAIKVKYVIQTEPVMRVILRDTNTDPYEGGNG